MVLLASEFRGPQTFFFVPIYGLPSFENYLYSSFLREHTSCWYIFPKNIRRRCWEQGRDCIQEVAEVGFEDRSGMAEGFFNGGSSSQENQQNFLFFVRSYCAELLFFSEGL